MDVGGTMTLVIQEHIVKLGPKVIGHNNVAR